MNVQAKLGGWGHIGGEVVVRLPPVGRGEDNGAVEVSVWAPHTMTGPRASGKRIRRRYAAFPLARYEPKPLS